MASGSNRMSVGFSGRASARPFQRAAARQRNVGLAVRERAAAKVDIHLVERQPLALVDGERPGQPHRELAEGAGHRLDDLLGRLVEGVAPAFPGCLLDLVLVAVDLDPDALLLQARDAGDGAVDPAPVGVVAQQHDLGAGLQHHRFVRRLRRCTEFAGHRSLVFLRHPGQGVEVGHVDALGGRVGGRQDHVVLALCQSADRVRRDH